VVPRKLYKAWDSDNNTMIALKLVELYGFAAASAWADQHLAVPSSHVRYALLDCRNLQALHCSIISDMPPTLTAYRCASVPFLWQMKPMQSCICRSLPGGFSVVSMPWLPEDQGWYILGNLTAAQLEGDRVWPAIQELLGRAHAPFLQ
jgi:hypothetical protein